MKTSAPDGDEPISRTSGREMANTLRDVLQDQEVRAGRRATPGRGPRRRSSPTEWMVLGVLAVLAVRVWLGAPEWLGPPPAEPIPWELREAGIRMEVAYQAHRILSFRQEEGRLPNSLQEAGDPFSEVQYARLGPQEFRLWMGVGETRVEYSSLDPLEPFLSPSRAMIMEGR